MSQHLKIFSIVRNMYAKSVNGSKSEYKPICSRMFLHKSSVFQKFATNKSREDFLKQQSDWWKSGARKVFGKYLLLTNTLSSGILMVVGDLIQQHIEYVNYGNHKDSYDWGRNKNMGIVGTIQGPITHFFYQILDKCLPGVKIRTIAMKILLDQAIASPFCIVLFFLGVNYLDNKNMAVAKKELKEKFMIVYTIDCSVWIPIQSINFYFLSARFRVLYINVVTMCYNVFLSYIKYTDV